MDTASDLRAAVALHAAGRLDEAEAACRRLVQRQPNHVAAVHLLGLVCHGKGQEQEALELLQRSVADRPPFPDFYSNLAGVLGEVGEYREAARVLAGAIRRWPESADAYHNLGVTLERIFKFARAASMYRQAIRLRPTFAKAHSHLGNALRALGRLEEAAEEQRAALRLAPDYAEAYNELSGALCDIGEPTEATKCYRRYVELRPDEPAAHSNLLMTMQHCAGVGPQEVFEEHLRWAERHERPHLARAAPHPRPPAAARRPLRVGYVSPDFRDHPVGRLLLPVIAAHDRSRVTVIAYSDVGKPDRTTDQFRRHCDTWRDTKKVSDDGLADLVRRDAVDILVDCCGHFGGNRLPVFARRPAPVQVAGFGYCSTSGMASMDYRLTDAYSDPPGQTEQYHTEQLVRLPHCCWCFRLDEPAPDVGPLPALSTPGRITFGCLNRPLKLNEEVVATWSRILLADAGYRLLLLAGDKVADNPHLLKKFRRHGVKDGQVELVKRRPRSQYLELHNEIDIGLDPFPFNGDNTICDGFWMGVPCVALTGDAFVSRRGFSHLSNVGLPELAAATPDEYVRVAVSLADDPGRLATLRAGLRQRLLDSPVGETAAYVRDLEAVYEELWRCNAVRQLL